jgi:cellulose biosynthesis protein BcsQ
VRYRIKVCLSAEAVDLGPWAPTLSFIRKEISKEEGEKQKRSQISEKDIEDAVTRLYRAKRDHDFVIGDAPGGMSENLRPIYQLATHAIILCREDKQTEIHK